MPGKVDSFAGVGMSAEQSVTVSNGQTSHGGTLDLGGNYLMVVVYIDDCAGIPASCDLNYATAFLQAEAVKDVYDPDDAGTLYGDSQNLPQTGTWLCALNPLPFAGVRHLKFTFTQTLTADVVIKARGFDPIVTTPH